MMALGLTASVGTPLLLWPVASALFPQALAGGAAGLWVVDRLWLILVLPALGWLAGRFVSAEPWPTAVGAAVVGEAYYVALDAASMGAGAWGSPKHVAWRLATLLAGMCLTRWAIAHGHRGRHPQN
jgi:hypothetical protein